MVTRKSLLVSLLSAAVVFSTAGLPTAHGGRPGRRPRLRLGHGAGAGYALRCHGAEPGFRGYPPAGDV